ncbi:hypothetical protein ACTFBT_38455 [Streptomyces microflavus]|uniref:Uncharacterized protein n=1 Tax=Streptomyces microflavus TaxID=1919 RepID=A0A7J0D6K0_STRMI|nr:MULTISPECIES: hypothetical protein [Streptomyces]MDX2982307.1 hypothetical protein [Streptomyces sp. NRRL_B-2249]GFN09717.1 hypothetical protein Smic_82730 [Streptomyces microflavus]GGY00430.1 hypothetical protein GCM10010298_76750 [Streptomyces microflavus]
MPALLNEIGAPVAATRAASVREQLLEMLAPVVADAGGYHDDTTTTRLRNETGGTWTRNALESTHGYQRAGLHEALATVD